MHAVAAPGRWLWGGIGLVTAVALAVPGARLLTRHGFLWHGQPPAATVTRTVTVTEPVTRLTVRSYGAPIRVIAGSPGNIRVVEQIWYDRHAGAPAAVPAPVSAGHLTLDASACEPDCSVSFSLSVPPGVTATLATGGGPATVSGIAGADVDSEGGPVSATRIDGSLTVSSGGGPVWVNGLSGPLRADSEGGDVTAQDVDAKTATVGTGGGMARIAFAAAPDSVSVTAEGGGITITVPGGPYALTAATNGGTEQFGIATDPAARRSIKADTGGGPLLIRPAPSRAGRR